MTADEHRRALARFEERTRELGLTLDRSDLLALFAGWQGLREQLARIRSVAGERPTSKPDRTGTHGPR